LGLAARVSAAREALFVQMTPPTHDPATGACVLHGEDEVDFVLDGAFSLSWQRAYVSSNAHCGFLGTGWTLPISFVLELGTNEVTFIDLPDRRTHRTPEPARKNYIDFSGQPDVFL